MLANRTLAGIGLLTRRVQAFAQVVEYPTPGLRYKITTGPDGALWFTESYSGKIARISTSGSITEHALPNAEASPNIIVAGPNAALWFTEGGANNIGRITTDARVTEYAYELSRSIRRPIRRWLRT